MLKKKKQNKRIREKARGFFVFLGVFAVKMDKNLGDLVKMQNRKYAKQNQKVCKNDQQKKTREKPPR